MEPSRWRCNSALGNEAIRLESKGCVIRESSVRQLRPASVHPRRKPERAHIGCRVRELANQNCGGLVVEAVVILVGEGIHPAARVAVGKKNGLQPAMRTKTSLEGAIGRVANEKRIIWPHREKRRIAVDQRGCEALIDRLLGAQVTVKIIGGVEGIMRLGHVIREYGGVQFCLFPLPVLQRFGQFLTVHTNLPGKQAVRFQLRFAKFHYRGFVVARQCLDGFVDDQPVSASAPRARTLRRDKAEHEASERDSRWPPRVLKRQSLHSEIPFRRDSLPSGCCASGHKNNRASARGSSRQRIGSSS